MTELRKKMIECLQARWLSERTQDFRSIVALSKRRRRSQGRPRLKQRYRVDLSGRPWQRVGAHSFARAGRSDRGS